MRKRTKQQLANVFIDMRCKNRECSILLQSGEYGKLLPYLAECQELAICAGNLIESAEKQVVEGTPLYAATIKKLEEYCELVYQVSISCMNMTQSCELVMTDQRDNMRIQVQNALGALDRYAEEVKCFVQEKIPDTIEAVFLPYKVSMWDSLESVWQAANADPLCDAYVVPIPYFDKNADGSITTMHYEGDEFPSYVPITDWKEYNVAKRHPDMIYIHNPYDNGNRVTTVYADYYAKELKQHTDMLVYIPYFVCTNDQLSSDFCVLPGTMYADKVIVQSEKVSQKYIQEIQEFEAENNCKGMFGDVEQKFVALGSPKYDKVLNTSREECEIPEDWRGKIESLDGARKKVVFYNTSVVTLLKGNEQVLDKLRSVLQIFKNRDDVVLLWRPHPLSDTTCNAMRPHLLEEYQRIVEEYRREGWGIYDDTSDLHRAIAISDVYYGDPSSVVELYRMTGKPIMIQGMDVKN